MPTEMREKIPGDRVRYLPPDGTEIENNWKLIRYEPDSGNAILERNATRVNVPRENFLLLNFPGSDDLYLCLQSSIARDPMATSAINAWKNNDLKTVKRNLTDIISRNAPAFLGIQTASDLSQKLVEREEAIDNSMRILKLDIGRAEQEYNRFEAKTNFERDKKDNLLMRLRNFQDQYATKLFEKNNLVPIWQELFRALSAIEFKLRN